MLLILCMLPKSSDRVRHGLYKTTECPVVSGINILLTFMSCKLGAGATIREQGTGVREGVGSSNRQEPKRGNR